MKSDRVIRFPLLAATAAFLLALPCAPAAPMEIDPARVDFLKHRVEKNLVDFEARVEKPDGDPTVRDLPSAALADLVLGKSPESAEKMLRHLFKLQNMDSGSPTFGSFPWQENHPEIADSNSDEFCLMPTGAVFVRYGEQFPEAFKEEALPHLKAGLAALRRRDVKTAYTNIYLMKMASMLLVGEAAQDEKAQQEAREELDNWIRFTHENGLTEYDSPTYTAVQAGCLETAYYYSHRTDIKPELKAGLDYMWTDLAGNYFPGTETLSGPESRYYNFLFGDQNINQLYYLAGLRKEIPGTTLFSDDVRLYTDAALPGYRPDAATLELANLPERTVRQTFGPLPGQDRYNYVTPDFAAGSASAFYGNQDNQISVSLKSHPALPFIELMCDTSDAPYGKIKVAEKSGHMKPKHLKDLIAAVQEKGAILALLDVGGADLPSSTSVATNVIVPVKADAVYLDESKVPAGEKFDMPSTQDSTIVVREGNAAVALRIFSATGAAGKSPAFRFKFDGNEWGAARLVAYHYQGANTKLSEHSIRAGVFIIAQRCDSDEAFNAFAKSARGLKVDQKNEGNVWSAALTAPDGTALEASLDAAKKLIGYRRVNGKEIQRAALDINGADYASKILEPFLPASPGSSTPDSR